MGYQDAQQVCLNGHQITDSYHHSPHLRKKFCPTCGEKTIYKCSNCSREIRGDYESGVIILGYSTPVPTHCENCGAAFPWTERKETLAARFTRKDDHFKLVEEILLRFHLIAKQLKTRYAGRETLNISDEYDVQDLLHSLLHIYFDDIRSEEWTPSYAGGC